MVLLLDILNNNNESNLRTKRTLTVRLISLIDLGITKHHICMDNLKYKILTRFYKRSEKSMKLGNPDKIISELERV